MGSMIYCAEGEKERRVEWPAADRSKLQLV
jgi:hypothetical protein